MIEILVAVIMALLLVLVAVRWWHVGVVHHYEQPRHDFLARLDRYDRQEPPRSDEPR